MLIITIIEKPFMVQPSYCHHRHHEMKTQLQIFVRVIMTFENGIDSSILNINRVITSSKQILFTYHITSLHKYPQKATNCE